MSNTIIIKKVNELPNYIKENDDVWWDYPMSELDYLFEQIEDGIRDNNSIMLLFENRLYEGEE